MEITRHFTATTFVVYQNKTLLLLHKKIGSWLPPGGHIDRDELPEDAAVREVKEETGLDVTLFMPDAPLYFRDDEARQLVRPFHIILESINPYHQHIDFIYYATSPTDALQPNNNETQNLKWLTEDELEDFDLFDNVKICAQEALRLLGA
ncbi:MAG: NUDIX hydrolase [Chloroflexi bacterium]|nr:NUDIX hydrolase [Chloroflexota bacterium]